MSARHSTAGSPRIVHCDLNLLSPICKAHSVYRLLAFKTRGSERLLCTIRHIKQDSRLAYSLQRIAHVPTDQHVDRGPVTGKSSTEGIAIAGLGVSMIALIGCTIAVATSHSLTLIADLCSAALDLTAEVLAYATFRIQRSRQRNLLDYGVGKVETLASLFIGLLTAFSVILIAFNAVESMVDPTAPTGFGITLGLVMSLFFGVTDGWLWWRCRREYAVNPSPIVATQTRMNATACITAVGVAGTLAITLLTQASWLHLLDMLTSVIIGAFATSQAWQMIRHSLHDVLDQSLAEPLQMIVNQHLVIHFDAYENLEKVRSRSSGSDVFIEIFLSFQPQLSISSIQSVINELTAGLEKDIRNSHVTVVASAYQKKLLPQATPHNS